jgi:membrane protein YdbS with pleckstrin-like domain
MSAEPSDYAVERERVARYFYWAHILFILLVGIWFFGAGLVVAVIYAITLGTWLPKKQAENLRYWLDGSTLRVDSGVYFLKRKSIPLDRVTDVALVQGPLLRWCDLWALHIQTAGMGGHSVAEAILYGLDKPEEIRDELIKVRDQAARRSTA